MRCKICCHPDRLAINLELLERTGRRNGVLVQLANRIGVSRHTLWRHRREHLKVPTARTRTAAPLETLSFAERARLLAAEADRIQLQAEAGAPRQHVELALRALHTQMRLLEMEAKFSGKTTKAEAEVALTDPSEEQKAKEEFESVVGATE